MSDPEAHKYKKDKNGDEAPSELRYDLISGDWVVVATGRARRPETFKEEQRDTGGVSPEECPFCQLETQKEPVLLMVDGEEVPLDEIPEDWTLASIPNLYPAVTPQQELNKTQKGDLYEKMDAVGYHEVLITRDHRKQLGQFSYEKMREVIEAYHNRFLDLCREDFVNYVFIFHNHGAEAGASIAHPHSQIITTPLIDADLKNALEKSKNYYEENNECVYCKANEWELEQEERVVYENDKFLVVCPFASRSAFQTIISPKEHLSNFEKSTEEERDQLADAMRQALTRIYKGLGDPPYNFYLHTAPCDGEDHDHYHWHFTILPKTSIWAGFELGAGMEISTIEPETAAEYLRNQEV
ncbi:MAG: galactose-1-phosphate uridylyltransferase [Candidatus Paceibacterota bacterium]